MVKADSLADDAVSFVLASASPRRRMLLENAGFTPSLIVSADIDESEKKNELPALYVRRMAEEKAAFVAKSHPGAVVLGADTIIAVGRRMIRKAADEAEAVANLKLLSGRSHRVLTGICFVLPNGRRISKTVTSKVTLKHLSPGEIETIVASGQWRQVAGYSIEGRLSALVRRISGSYPNILGLPIFEVAQILKGKGFRK